MTRTLLLDLDGTILDTAPDLTSSLNRLGMKPAFAAADVARSLDDGLDVMLERACAVRGRRLTAEIRAAFAKDYTATAASRPYDGVLATLRRMVVEGWCLAVCTNNPEELAHAALAGLGFPGLLGAIAGCDTFGVRKPDPQHLIAALRAADGSPEQAVMVGDHAHDVTAAQAAGIPCIFAGWGYGPVTMATGASAFAMHFSDVHGLAARLL